MPQTLDLGVVFTGNSEQVTAAAKAVRDVLTSLNMAMSKMGGSMKGFAAGLSTLSKSHKEFQRESARTTQESQAFKNAMEVGRRALEGDNQAVQQFRKSLVAFARENRARALSTDAATKATAVEANVINLARGAWDKMTKTAKGLSESSLAMVRTMSKASDGTLEAVVSHQSYEKAIKRSTDRSAGFKQALDEGYLKLKDNITGFNQYFKALEKFDDKNTARANSLKESTKALAVDATSANLSKGAYEELEKVARATSESRTKTTQALVKSTEAVKATTATQTAYQAAMSKSAGRTQAFKNSLETASRQFDKDVAGFNQYFRSLQRFDDINRARTLSTKASASAMAVEANAVNLSRGAWDLFEKTSGKVTEEKIRAEKAQVASTKATKVAMKDLELYDRIVAKETLRGKAFADALDIGAQKFGRNGWELGEYAKALVKFDKQNERNRASIDSGNRALAVQRNAVNLAAGAWGIYRGSQEQLGKITEKTNVVTKEAVRTTSEISAIQKEYSKVVSKLTDESTAFRNALETGTRITRNVAEFKEYTTALKDFDSTNRRRAQSTDVSTKAMAVEATATNLSRGAIQALDEQAAKGIVTNEKVAATYDASKVKAQGASNSIDAYKKVMSAASMESKNYQTALQGIIDKHGIGSIAYKKAVASLNTVQKTVISTAERMNQAGRAGDAFANSANVASLANQHMAGTLKAAGGVFERIKVPIQQNITLFGTWKEMFQGALQTMAAWGPATMLVYGFVNALKAGIGSVLEFDQALKDLKAITFATDAEMLIMSETIKKLGINYMFSISQISTGMKILGQAGFSASESIDTIRAVSILAAGTLSGMEETADLLTTTIRAFRLEASESGRVADIMATAVNKSKLDVDKLRIAFSYMAPAAKEAGISLEEAATATMLLADSGLRASTIGTSFRQFLAHLIAPTESAKGKLAALGANMDKLNPQFNSLKSILVELNRIIPDAGAAFDIFQLRAAPAVITMMKAVAEGSDTYDEYLEKVYEVGVAQKMADIQMEGVINKVKNLGSRFTVLAVSIGQSGVLGAFGMLVDVLAKTIELFTFLTGGLGQYIIAMTLAGGVTYGLVKALSLLGGLKVVQWFGAWAIGGFQLATVFGVLKTAVNGLWRALSANPAITILVSLASVAVGLKMYLDHVAQLGTEYAAQAIEVRKTEDKLQSYQNRLTSLNKDSLEYHSTLKRLASEYEPLKKYIDEVTGAWIDETAGLKALDEEIKETHVKAIAKQIDSISAQKMAIAFAAMSFNELSDGVVDTKKETEQLTLFIKGLVPELKRLGVNASYSGEQIRAALTNMYPSLDNDKILSIADNIIKVLKDVEAKEEEARKKKADLEVLYAQGTRTRVPAIFKAMYADVGGLRAADAADLVRKYDEALEKEQKHFDDRLINYEEFEARKFQITLEYIDKVAQASKSELSTQGDVEKAKTEATERTIDAAEAAFKNQLAEEKEGFKKRLEENKGFPDKVKDITKKHLETVQGLESKAAAQITIYWQWAWENRKKMSKESFDALIQHIMDYRAALAGAEGEVTNLPGGGIRGKIPRKDETEPFTPTPGMVATDEEVMNKYKRQVEEAIALSGTWGKQWAYEWEKASDYAKTELGALAEAFVIVAKAMGGTETQQARGRELAAKRSLDSYLDTIKKRGKAAEDAAKSEQKFGEKMLDAQIKGSEGSAKFVLQQKKDLEQIDEDLKEFKEKSPRDWSEINPDTGKFVKKPEITDPKAREEARQKAITDSEAEAEKAREGIRSKSWYDQVKHGQTLYDAKADFDHKYLSFMKSNSDKLEAEYTDYADDMKQIDRMVYDAKVWNATHADDQIEGIEEKARSMREAREEKHQANLDKIAQKGIDKKIKLIDKDIEAQRDRLEVTAGLEELEALKAGAGQEVLLGVRKGYAEQLYAIDRNATDRALAEIDTKTDYGAKMAAKYVNQEIQAYNQVIAANRAYYQELYKDSEYYYKNQLIADEEYFQQLENLRKWGAISNREYTEKMITLNGSMGERISLGFSRAKASMQSFGEMVVDWSTQAPEQWASGFTSAFKEFAQGTKTAAQAWQDFAESFMWWCAEMMIKWAAMKAMGMLMGSTGAMSGSAPGSAGSLMFALERGGGYHRGGIIGIDPPAFAFTAMASAFNNAQKLHSGGIAGDERPVIMKKGEGAFTEAQMKALGPSGGNLNITNITDPRVIDAYMATPQGRRSVLNIIGAEAFKVKRILRAS